MIDRRLVITIAVTAAATWGVSEVWESFGWTTPEQHDADMSERSAQIEHLHEDVQKLTGYWDCYNLGVDIGNLLDIEHPTGSELEALRQLRNKSDELGCSPLYE